MHGCISILIELPLYSCEDPHPYLQLMTMLASEVNYF